MEPIFGNYWKLLSEKTSRLRRKEETSLYKIILCGYLRFIELTLIIEISGWNYDNYSNLFYDRATKWPNDQSGFNSISTSYPSGTARGTRGVRLPWVQKKVDAPTWCDPEKLDTKLNINYSTLYSSELGIVPGSFLLTSILVFYC